MSATNSNALFTLLILIFTFNIAFSQHPLTIGDNFELGGSSGDLVHDFIVDTDGSIYVVGQTSSTDADFSPLSSGFGAFIMKVNGAGTIEWVEAIKSSSLEFFYDIHKSSDGFLYAGGKGIINSGVLESLSGVVSENTSGGNLGYGGYDGVVMKVSTGGVVQWIRTYGSGSPDLVFGLHDNPNGDLAVIANTISSGGNDVPVTNINLSKIWIFTVDKTDGAITTVNQVHAGNQSGNDVSLNPSKSKESANGYVIIGSADPTIGTNNCAQTHTSQSSSLMMLSEFNHNGNLLWDNYFGSNGSQKGRDLSVNDDGTITAVGYSANASNTCDVPTVSYGLDDVYVVKTQSNGDFIWASLFGGQFDDDGSGIVELPNGNYLISAYSTSSDIGPQSNGNVDVYVFEITSTGDYIFNHELFGGTLADVNGNSGSSLLTSDCYMYKDTNDNIWFASSAKSNNGDLPGTLNNTTSDDIWIAGLGEASDSSPDCQWIGFVYNPFSQYREDNETPCSFVSNGLARIDPSATSQSTYWTSFVNPNNFNLDGDEVSLEVRLRNNSSDGGIFCYDTELWLFGENNYATVGLMTTNSTCEQYAFIGTEDVYLSGQNHDLSSLQLNLSNYRNIKLEVSNSTVKVYDNTTLLYTVQYSQSLGNLTGIKIAFKGSGTIDWVELTDLNTGSLVYDEQFNNCNDICPNCNQDMNLYQHILPSGQYEAADLIQTNSKIQPVSNVVIQAGEEIILDSGFETIMGAIFEALIGGCGT